MEPSRTDDLGLGVWTIATPIDPRQHRSHARDASMPRQKSPATETEMLDMLASIRKARQEGFTLIELLIVIVILGILAAIVVFAVGGITDKGNASACKSDLKTVEVASEAYFAQNKSYAPNVQ